jgi:hypothetical protein
MHVELCRGCLSDQDSYLGREGLRATKGKNLRCEARGAFWLNQEHEVCRFYFVPAT